MFNPFKIFADNSSKDSVSYRLRQERFNNFIKILDVNKNDRILDVGGTETAWIDSGLERNVTLLNLNFDMKYGNFKYIEGDACKMEMFADKSFDIIYSNSVIEHVGKGKQKEFAGEIRRVGIKYWVQTPYRHFPVEPHFVFPFFQYFPLSLKKLIALNWPYSHYKMGNAGEVDILDDISKIYLLNQKELKELFNDCRIFHEKYLGIVKSIVAYKN